jgi:hypothetical protein
MFKLNFFHQIAAAEETAAPAEIIVREDFTLFNVDQMTVIQLLQTLRADTIDFAEDNRLTWAASDFVIKGVPLRVKLTENHDVIYIFDGETIFTSKDAAAFIQTQAVQF